MALETLRGVTSIDGFKVCRGKPKGMSWKEFDETRKEKPIHITDKVNMISFRVQDGPIKEKGVNGCQVDTLVKTAEQIIEALDEKSPSQWNSRAIGHLRDAYSALKARKRDEGTPQI